MSNAAILYLRDGFDTSRTRLMGRHAAGEGMLRGMARWLEADRHHAYVPDQASFDDFAGKMKSFGMRQDARCVRIDVGDLEALSQVGCLFLSQPNLDTFAWERRFADQRDYSLCGLTHTTASHAAMDAIGALLTAPLQRWDAVICTSTSAKATFEHVLAEYGDYLRARLGATDVAVKPMLPVIPLGIHCDQFDPADRTEQRAHWRELLGIGSDDLVVLYVGRLSFHAKAHPFPMYRALEMVSGRVAQKIHLVQAGWFANEKLEKAFRDGAHEIAPGVTHHFVDGRGAAARFGIWHVADVFCSLSDNIQETFGLTPLEAMAAGLPVVASDWDGYRETVEHGVQGLLVPTFAPAPGHLADLSRPYTAGTLTYDFYLLNTSNAVAVDIDGTAKAFEHLFGNPDLRRRMGEAGRRRARDLYDWKVIIGRYAELWQEMAEIRRTGDESCATPPGRPPAPLRDDPFAVFANYATEQVGTESRITGLGDEMRDKIARLRGLDMNRSFRFPADDLLAKLCDSLSDEPRTLSEILGQVPRQRHGLVTQTVLWLKKMGLVEIERGERGAGGGR